jgi:adenylate cyclase
MERTGKRDAPQHKVSKALEEIAALKRNLNSFADALEKQRLALLRMQSTPPSVGGVTESMISDTMGSAMSVAGIAQQMRQLLPQFETSLDDLQAEFTAQAKEHEQLAALYNVSSAVNSTLDLAELLNLVMDMIISVTGAERGFLMLVNEETGELDFRVARNMDRETLSGSSFEISRSIVNKVAKEGTPVLTTNAQEDDRFSAQASVVSYSLRSILCVPLSVKGKITGVIYSDNRIKAGLFSPRERDLLAAFADQAAVAIENARLFERVKLQLEEITNMKNLMDNIFTSIASGVITTDTMDNITTFNRAAELILGIPANKAQDRPFSEALSFLKDSPLPYMIEEVKQHDRRYIGYEIVRDLPDRGQVSLSMHLSSLKDPEEEPLGVAIVVDDLTEKKRYERERTMLKRYLPPELIDQLPDDLSALKLGGKRQLITTLFADIRGFTTFSERSEAERVVEIINRYFALAYDAVRRGGGLVDKYLGDAIMAHYNTPLNPVDDHAKRAVQAAWKIKKMIEEQRASGGLQVDLSFGMGVNTGEAVLGNVGAEERMDYTAIGDAVNLAKRLQECAGPGQILLSNSTYELTKGIVIANKLKPIKVKGRSALEQIYELMGLKQ